VESAATSNPGIGANAGILGVAAQPDGKIVIGDDFASVEGQPRNRLRDI